MMTTDNRTDLVGLLNAVNRGDWSAWLPLMDCLDEVGALPGLDIARMRKYTRHHRGWAPAWLEECLVRGGVVTWGECHTHRVAVIFQVAVDAVDLRKVGVVCHDRSIDRREQARLCRELFKRLGLKGASITTPSYSMASTVDIALPKRRDVRLTEEGSFDRDCPAVQANRATEDKVKAILAHAFPNHDDRSDSSTDYFDARWSIN